jgi:hypothetical protein
MQHNLNDRPDPGARPSPGECGVSGQGWWALLAAFLRSLFRALSPWPS